MKLALILSLVFETALCSPGTLVVDFHRARKGHGGYSSRGNALAYERYMSTAAAHNEIVPESLTNGFYAYFANLTIGSNDQEVHPMIDTGSSDLWVTSISNPYCTQDTNGFTDSGEQWDCTGYIFDPSSSTTYHNLSEPYHISYADTTGAYGWVSQDTVKLGGATLPNATFAYATTANSSDSVFGVGYKANEATTRFFRNGTITGEYTNVPVSLKEDGFINSVAYSLYLNDVDAQNGQILFGGVDHAKYNGTLGLMPLVNTYYPLINQTIEFTVRFTGMGVRTGDSVCPLADFVIPALLDSGTSYAVLPSDLVDVMGEAMGYQWPTLSNATFWQGSCSPPFDFDSFELDFLGHKLQVPPQSLLDYLQDLDGAYVYDNQGNQQCILAIEKAEDGDDYVLGDVFQRNWYVVYDLDNYQVALAQSKLNETSESDVEPIVSSIPGATSVKNYNLGGFQSSISTHGLASSCLVHSTSKPVSASKSATPSSQGVVSASSASSTQSGGSRKATVTALSSAGATPFSSTVGRDSANSASSSIPAGVAISSNGKNSSVDDVTTVVSSFVTTCPSPTTFATNGQTYTVTDSTVLTITNCPCTLTHKAPSKSSEPVVAAAVTASVESSTTNTGSTASATELSSTRGASFVTTCPTPTTLTANGQTYTVTESTVLTITDCSCTLSKEKSAVTSQLGKVSSVQAASNSSSTPATTTPSIAQPTSSKTVLTVPSPSQVPELAAESSVPVLANTASRINTTGLTALIGAIILFLI